nr:adenylate/guanylate cyclase domain-containing protein [uncultured Undibacterium sp.]
MKIRNRLTSRIALSATWWWVLIAVSATCICASLQWSVFSPLTSVTHTADELLRDRFIKLRSSDTPEDRIAVVDINEASLAALGPWPWSREKIATLVEQLVGEYHVKGVALDIFFSNPGDALGDQRLAMLTQYGPVVLAQAFDYDLNRFSPWQVGSLSPGKNIQVPSVLAGGFIANHAVLAKNAKAGNIGFLPDQDGVLRRLPTWTHYQGANYPTLSLALFACCAADTDASKKSLAIAAASAHSDAQGFNRLEYSKTLSAYRVISAHAIFERTIPVDMMRDKLVIIGSSALSLSDRVPTPLFFSTSGFLVHATALTSLLDAQAGLIPAKWPGKWIALLYSFLVASLAAYAFPRYSALSNSLILVFASTLWLGLAYVICQHDAWFSPTGPLLSHFFLLSVAVPFGWSVSQGKSRRLLSTLQQYVAKSVVQELLRSDLKDPLAPRELHITTLIADMEAYTSQVEHLPIEAAAQLTRDFLECLTLPVLDHGGTLDKYTGDGLVAFWGAPLPLESHTDLAIDAAIIIVKNVHAFSLRRQAEGLKPLRVRIGIESGVAIAGDFGSSLRSIYTAVGDSVNVASRLEDAARHFKHDIIIGQGAVDNDRTHQFIQLGERILRGKEKATSLYTVEVRL